MIKIFFTVIFLVAIVKTQDGTDSEEFSRCVKVLKKFMITRVCAQQELAVECLNIGTTYVTQVLDYCYKELNYDPINLSGTLQYVCSYEETIVQSAECLCRAADLIKDFREPNFTDDSQYEYISENVDHQPNSYKDSMIHCLHYMDSIYQKRKFVVGSG